MFMPKDFAALNRVILRETSLYPYPIPRWSEGPSSPVGHLSTILGLDVVFRAKLLKILDLGYSLRLRLPLLIAGGFTLFRLLNSNNYIPRVDIEFRVVEDEELLDVETEEEEGDPEPNDPTNN